MPPEIYNPKALAEIAANSALPKLQEDSGVFESAWSGFKERAGEAVNEPGETLGRSSVSLAVGGAIAFAARGKGLGTAVALGTAGASALQAAWTYAFDDDKSHNSAHKAGEILFDTVALGALPGAIGAGVTSKAMNYFRPGASSKSLGVIPEGLAPLGDDAARLGNDAAKLNLTPLNAWSRSGEQIGRDISNFSYSPFTLDGRKYASVEGFYNSLLYNDPARRAKIAEMWGLEAKMVGKSSNNLTFQYGKETIKLGSEEHHRLIERAIRAKFEQNPDITKAFVATHPRPIIHDVGFPDKPGTPYPREVLESVLTRIRNEYVQGIKIIGG